MLRDIRGGGMSVRQRKQPVQRPCGKEGYGALGSVTLFRRAAGGGGHKWRYWPKRPKRRRKGPREARGCEHTQDRDLIWKTENHGRV